MDADARHVVVAGGHGFIGRPLCRALLARGYRVSVLTRGAARPAGSGSPEMHTWDGRSTEGWGKLADGAFALVNLAGESIGEGRWTQERKRAILQSRVLAGEAMTQAVEQASVKPGVLVQASAVGYYGDTGQAAVDESSPPGKGFLTEICLRWEESTQPVEGMGVRRVVARTGLVLGREGGVLQKMLTPFKMFLGGPLGDGSQGFPWIHLDDEILALLFLMERSDAAGVFNLTAPEAVSNLEFCRSLGEAMSRPCGLAAPAAMLRLAFGEMADELLLSGCLAFPRRLVEMGFAFSHPRLGEALRDLFA